MRTQRSARTFALAVALAATAVVVIALAVSAELTHDSHSAARSALASNPELDPGTPVSGRAPDFTLEDESGRRVSLHSFLGHVVILAFNDSQCTTICPLTTTAMVDAKRLLGPAGSQVQLLGVDANPTAITIRDVRAYSEVHGMLGEWYFLTGSLRQLERVWREYKIAVAIEHGQIDHTPALFVIDTKGRLARLYLTQQSYAAVDQLGALLAQEAAGLLPGRPRLQTTVSYSFVEPITSTARVNLPRAGGGTVALGPGSPRLLLFFATWDAQLWNLGAQLSALNRYQLEANARGLPGLTAVDEGSVEPSPGALPALLSSVHAPLAYPVAVDESGRIGDGYEVQDEPWLVLVSRSGQILWYYDVSTSGWLTADALAQRMSAALAAPPKAPTNAAAIQQELAGSPAALAALHEQAGQLLGSASALTARVRALRGYPIVINAWASWCGPCRAEFGLLAVAAGRYGRRVAFLGADTEDSAGDARAFLSQHPVSYPSYQTTTSDVGSLAGIAGLPTTIFVDRSGKVAYVHTGQYDSQGTLDEDVANYALGG